MHIIFSIYLFIFWHIKFCIISTSTTQQPPLALKVRFVVYYCCFTVLVCAFACISCIIFRCEYTMLETQFVEWNGLRCFTISFTVMEHKQHLYLSFNTNFECDFQTNLHIARAEHIIKIKYIDHIFDGYLLHLLLYLIRKLFDNLLAYYSFVSFMNITDRQFLSYFYCCRCAVSKTYSDCQKKKACFIEQNPST